MSQLELKHLNERERVLARPNVNVGSTISTPNTRYLYDWRGDQVSTREISIPTAIERLFLEALSNASDNAVRSRQIGVPPGKIWVEMTRTQIVIRNQGKPFPIQKYDSDRYDQEMAFGVLGTSTNYDDSNREGVSGENGLGIKLVNIFSQAFEVDLVDGKQKLRYQQRWSENMKNREDPQITKTKEKTYTQVQYDLDFSQFGSEYQEGYTDEVIMVYLFHCLSTSFNHGMEIDCTVLGEKVVFNNYSMGDYIDKVFGIDLEKTAHLTHVEWETNQGLHRKKSGNNKIIAPPKKYLGSEKIKLCLLDTPDQAQTISFVNNLITYNHGAHVEKIFQEIRDTLLKELNEKYNKENSRGNLSIRDLRSHVSMMLMCSLDNTKYDSQSKNHLRYPQPKWDLKKEFRPLFHWNLVSRLRNEIEAKQIKILNSSNGKNKYNVEVKGLEDAPKAGTKESHKCILDINEGKSAQNYSIARASHLYNGRIRSEYLGSLAFRGKPINVLQALQSENGINKLANNKEYIAFKKAAGLKEGVDYLNDQNYHGLRYGEFNILADSDVDGKHIIAIIILMIYFRFRTLLTRGVVKILRTPIIRVRKNQKSYDFLTIPEYERWAEKNGTKGMKVKYCKGLASSSEEEIARDSQKPRLVQITLDNAAEIFLEMAFGSDSQKRKKWMRERNSYPEIEKLLQLPISTFINCELVEHAWANLQRTIPGYDGLKPCQRKALYTAFFNWGKKEEVNTNILTSRAVEYTNYHYGPPSLLKAIQLMPLDYPGSNNLPYFGKGGSMGTRKKNGKNAGAARYTSLLKQDWWSLVYRKEDQPLWKYTFEDGEQGEPVNLLPIVPMFLINGARGLGTGWKTFFPNCNPVDICNQLIDLIEGRKPPKIQPWYRGFKGNAKVIININKNNQKFSKNVLEPDADSFEGNETGRCMMVTGVAQIEEIKIRGEKTTRVIITELPINVAWSNYEKGLQRLRKEKEIRSYQNRSNNEIYFEVIGMKNPDLTKLSLRKLFPLNNLNLIDDQGELRTFQTLEESLVDWFHWRKQYYYRRVENIINTHREEIKKHQERYRFIKAVVDGIERGRIPGETIIIIREPNQSIYQQMDQMNLDHKLLRQTNSASFTQQGLKELEDKIKEIQAQIDTYQKIEPTQIWKDELRTFRDWYQKNWINSKK